VSYLRDMDWESGSSLEGHLVHVKGGIGKRDIAYILHNPASVVAVRLVAVGLPWLQSGAKV
jgi:hypothetical protein